jgi:hypothetical protein
MVLLIWEDVDRAHCWSWLLGTSGQQLICDCRSAGCKDCALKYEGNTTVWFKVLDRRKQECTAEADRRNIKKSYHGGHGRPISKSGKPVDASEAALFRWLDRAELPKGGPNSTN